jgi:hypothetical protein
MSQLFSHLQSMAKYLFSWELNQNDAPTIGERNEIWFGIPIEAYGDTLEFESQEGEKKLVDG